MGIEQDALARLGDEQGEQVAGLAKVALERLTGEYGVEAVTALELQEFLWLTIPVKWFIDDPQRLAQALGRFFALAGLDRYARLCTSAQTQEILAVYATRGADAGRDAYHEAARESGLIPPDTPSLAWGIFTGAEESDAYHSCSAAIEVAIAARELRVGARGWEKVRTRVVEDHLAAPRPGGTWLEWVHAERLKTWTRPRNRRKADFVPCGCRAAARAHRDRAGGVPAAALVLGQGRRRAENRDGLVLEVRKQIGFLLRSVGQAAEAEQELDSVLPDLIAVYGADSPEVAEVRAALTRLRASE